MRYSSGTDDNVSVQQVASTNSTANLFLGGTSRSWMLDTPAPADPSAVSPVRPVRRAARRRQTSAKSPHTALPSPAPSDEPSPLQHNNRGRDSPVEHAQAPSRPPECPPAQPLQQQVNIPSGQTTVQAPPPPPPPTAWVQEPRQPLPSEILRSQGRPEQATGDSAIQTAEVQEIPRPYQSEEQPTKRRKMAQSNAPSLGLHVPILDNYVSSIGGDQQLSDAEQRRFVVLRDACLNQDYYYVAIHQIFYRWAFFPEDLFQTREFLNARRVVETGCQILTPLMQNSNSPVRAQHGQWFSEFPAPLSELIFRSSHYRAAVSAVIVTLGKLSIGWMTYTTQCEQRGYPPLVDELVTMFGVTSSILQVILFVNTRRRIGIPEDEYSEAMMRIFDQDGAWHRELSARYNTAYPPTEEEINKKNAWLINRYLVIRAEQSRHRNSMLGSNAPHGVPSPTHGPPYIGPPQPHQVQGPGQSSRILPSLQLGIPQYQNQPYAQPHLQNVPYTLTAPNGAFSGNAQPPQYSQPQVQNAQYGPSTAQNGSFPGNPQSPQLAQVRFQNVHYAMPSAQNGLSSGYPPQSPSPLSGPGQWPHQMHAIRQNASPLSPMNVTSPTLIPRPQMTQQRPGSVNQAGGPVSRNSALQQRPQPETDSVSGVTPAPVMPSQLTANGRSQNFPHNVPMLATMPAGQTLSSFRPQHQQGPGTQDPNNFIPRFPLPQHPPRPPNPTLTALHQAHLRSPELKPVDLEPGLPPSDPSNRYYQAISSCAVGPVVLSTTVLEEFRFTIPSDVFANIVPGKPTRPTKPLCREVKHGSLQYRIRCVRLDQDQKTLDIPEWAVADTTWPPTIFLQINNTPLEIRRKLHYGKDLPIDITPHVAKHGADKENVLKVFMTSPPKTKQHIRCGLAIEVIEVLRHAQIIATCLTQQLVPASQTLQAITSRLSGAAQDDDDIALVSAELTIDLEDPFTLRIFDVPVKGADCRHAECFDLETWLLTRPGRERAAAAAPCLVDVWRCPLCRGDARPRSLRVDGFLCDVRRELEKSGRLATKAILVAGDGTWSVKPEMAAQARREGSRAEEAEGEGEKEVDLKGRVRVESENPAGKSKTPVEVIEIDDD